MQLSEKRAAAAMLDRPGIRSSLPTGTTREIVETLGRRIANGFYAVGEVIPKEDQLAASLGVSRTTVRDAIKVLSGKSLVRTARRYGTRVQPVDDWNLLDPDVLAWHEPAHPRFQAIFVEAMELRRMIEPEAAALAAVRASPAQRRAILEAAEAFAQARGEVALLFAADCRFHTAVIAATGNLMITMMGQPVGDVLRTRLNRHVVAAEHWAEVDACHTTITEHIARGEAAQAEEAMRSHLLDLRDIYGRPGAWKSD